ncbi:MAG: putative diguanylate cyclase/phosphodiesterase, partial [Rhodoferax sp.]|nr:putative diguanylate cyclase/phosphodiesterase [Rhodoferax sp.]
DTNDASIGSIYTNPDIEMTMLDGTARVFVGPDASTPGAMAKQVVVALQADPSEHGSPTVGAIVLEYTGLYDALMQETRRSSTITALVALVLVLMGCTVAVRTTRSIVRPLEKLQRAVTQIAAEKYASRVDVQTRDELGRLGAAFNQMAEDLGRGRAALVDHVADLAQANVLLEDGMKRHQQDAERIQYLAYHDNLTGLPNRAMFGVALSQALGCGKRYGGRFAAYFIDLDRFKQINDTLGHAAGDLLLKEVASRLQMTLRASDTVARLGGDEFVVLVPELQDDTQAETVARKILGAISRPFSVPGQELRVTCSVGISRFPDDGADEQTLMKHADIAMYQAKEAGRNGFAFYSAERNVNSFERLALESSLRRALERDELLLHYQPKKDFRSGETAGMEVLLRWQHPDLGMVSPTQFIPVAEETGLIVPIGKWVLRTACRQTMAWQAAGLAGLVVAVNLSPRQFIDESFLDDVLAILAETGMDPKLLELEITESMIMHDVERGRALLNTLKALGIRIAIDDFGTGYSSLATLKQFPIDTLKVDRSFIRDLETDAEDRGLTEAIIAMAKTLSLHLVAEGVETVAQSDFLRARGCDELQGFLFSKPVPAAEFERFVKVRRNLLGQGDQNLVFESA